MAPLVAVVALMEAMAPLPCAAATVVLLVATHPEVVDTEAVTVVVAVPAAASTPTEQRPVTTMIGKLCALRSIYLQTVCGKSSGRTMILQAGKKRAEAHTCVLREKFRNEEFCFVLLLLPLPFMRVL